MRLKLTTNPCNDPSLRSNSPDTRDTLDTNFAKSSGSKPNVALFTIAAPRNASALYVAESRNDRPPDSPRVSGSACASCAAVGTAFNACP